MSMNENWSHKYRMVVCTASQESLVLVDAWDDVHGSEVIRLVEPHHAAHAVVVGAKTDRGNFFDLAIRIQDDTGHVAGGQFHSTHETILMQQIDHALDFVGEVGTVTAALRCPLCPHVT